jgi:hypothetical protein
VPTTRLTRGARRFLYLDVALTKELLAGAERGVYQVEKDSRSREAARELGGKVGVGALGTELGVQASGSAKVEQRIERELEQTPESLFSRLAEIVREEGSLRRLESLDTETRSELRSGDLIEAVGTVSIDNLNWLTTSLVHARAMARELEDEGEAALKAQREKSLAALLARIYNLGTAIPGFGIEPELTAVVPGVSGFEFGGKLDARCMGADLAEARQEHHVALFGQLDAVRETAGRLTVVAIYR